MSRATRVKDRRHRKVVSLRARRWARVNRLLAQAREAQVAR